MATYKILYWQEIPSQIVVEDDADEVKLELPSSFAEHIDELAEQRGLQSADDYLAQWRWSEEEDRDGSAQEVAHAVLNELIGQFNHI